MQLISMVDAQLKIVQRRLTQCMDAHIALVKQKSNYQLDLTETALQVTKQQVVMDTETILEKFISQAQQELYVTADEVTSAFNAQATRITNEIRVRDTDAPKTAAESTYNFKMAQCGPGATGALGKSDTSWCTRGYRHGPNTSTTDGRCGDGYAIRHDRPGILTML